MFQLNTIKSRILTYSGLLLVMVVALITTIFYLSERQRIVEARSKIIQLEVDRESIFVEREFSKIYENSQSLSFVAEDMIESTYDDGREKLLSLSERLIEENPNIIGVNLYFEDDLIGSDTDFIGDNRFQNDGQFISYISKQNGVLNIEYIDNYDTYEFYTKALQVKQDFFTEPYHFTIQGNEEYISTVVFPIVDQGEFLGLVGVDFTAEYIFERMMLLDSRFERRDIIVSQDGTILLNTENTRDFGDHISKIHEYYFNAMESANVEGLITGTMPNGNFEVIKTIELASTGSNWYIFSDVQASEFLGDVNQITYQTIAIGLLSLILGLGVLYFINYRVTKPIITLSNVVSSYDIETSDIEIFDIDTKGLVEIELLRDNFVSTLELVQSNLKENNSRITMQSKQLLVQKATENNISLTALCNSTVEAITKETNAIIGALYIKENNVLNLVGTSGVQADVSKTIEIGKGLIGKVAKTQESIMLEYPKDSEMLVDFGLETAVPPHVLLFPLVENNEVIAVLELVAIKPFDKNVITILEKSSYVITASIIKQQSIEKTKQLLEETQNLAEELDKKQQDLEVQNEELESQQEELRVTNEELETQQEELRVTNEELQSNINQIEQMNNELENARKELEVKTMEAERSNKYKSDFLANMSHELRTPLNSILILSNLITENDQADEKAKEYAETIHSSGSDLLELINGILDLAKVESGKEEVNVKDWDVIAGVNELKKRYVPLTKKKGIEFNIEMPDQLNSLRTDPKKIKLILTNLLSNAIKFTQKGSVTLQIQENDDDFTFEVIDTGIGISGDKLESIFDEFNQVESDNTRSFGGTGLGLSICRKYASLLQGRISVESTLNEGSTFRLFVPKDAFKNKSTIAQNQPKKEKKVRAVKDKTVVDDRHYIDVREPSILIIDDNETFLTSMRDYFKEKNINVIVSDTAENGLYLADFYLPNIIIIDEKLPKMTGREAIKRLKENPRTANCKCYIISGQVNDIKIKDVPFLPKPLKDETLKDIVKEMQQIAPLSSRIMLIEDNPTHQKVITEYLQNNKNDLEYWIDTVSTKKEALKHLQKSNYVLLVMDLTLPDSSGFELIETIREDEKFNTLPIIVYTGQEFSKEEEEHLSNLVQDIIIKGDESPVRLLHDIELFMSQKDKRSIVTDKTLFQGKTVLVVDDDIRNIFALTGLLESYDITVKYNTSGQEAIDRLHEENHIDLVIMDIMMPEMNGYETMEVIREHEKFKELPIIALTAKSMRGDREKCIQAGANEYLSKPLNKNKLLSVLRVWLP